MYVYNVCTVSLLALNINLLFVRRTFMGIMNRSHPLYSFLSRSHMMQSQSAHFMFLSLSLPRNQKAFEQNVANAGKEENYSLRLGGGGAVFLLNVFKL